VWQRAASVAAGNKPIHSRMRADFHHRHHHHHFICPIIQHYAHLREYDSRRAGQQGPIRTLTAAIGQCWQMPQEKQGAKLSPRDRAMRRVN